MSVGDSVSLTKLNGEIKTFRVTKIFGFFGLKREEIQTAYSGDIVAVSGMDDINVGETVCPSDNIDPLPVLHIDEPTLQMTFLVNNSPFAGKEGKWVTASKIEDRLMQQLETDVSLKVEQSSADSWIVSGRGELHLSILIENMRREGFELQVSKPQVIVKQIEGNLCEPIELVQIDTPDNTVGAVIESIGQRKGDMIDMQANGNGQTRLTFNVPARGLIGYRTEFMSITKGYGILNHTFDSYKPLQKGKIGGRRNGVLVALENGQATAYSISSIEERGTIFVEPGTDVYGGMIVGENNRENDITVNITKAKAQTNVRSSTKDQTVTLKKPRIMTLEESLEYLNDDEYLEVTPNSIRLRKKELDKSIREKNARKAKYSEE